jgi:hypothetical protein
MSQQNVSLDKTSHAVTALSKHLLTKIRQTHGVPEERHPSDRSVRQNGPGVKEVRDTDMQTTLLDNSPRPSTAPSDPNAPLVLTEANAFKHTAYHFSNRKKWAILTVVGLCQTSMSK